MCNCTYGCPKNSVRRNWLYRRNVGLRRRTGFRGLRGVHAPSPTTWTLAPGHCITLDQMFGYLDTQLTTYRSPKASINWIGCAGTVVCKPGYHSLGRAFDVTKITLGGGKQIDMNLSWRPSQPMLDRRLYLAVIAAARIHTSYVLTAYWRNRNGDWDTSHDNHIHLDNARGQSANNGPAPLSTNSEADTVLVQLACNWLVGADLTVDGQFGPATNQAYRRLKAPRHLNIMCRHPYHNYWDMAQFLHLICVTALSNSRAGAFKADC